MATVRLGVNQRDDIATSEDTPLRRLIAGFYIQAFRDLVFLADHAQAVQVLDTWDLSTTLGKRIHPDLVQACGIPEYRVKQVWDKMRMGDPRVFFADTKNPWHGLLPMLGLDIEPEDLRRFADLELVNRNSAAREWEAVLDRTASLTG